MVTLLTGDCRELLAQLAADSIDAVVTDPPYDLTAGKKGGSGDASVSLDSPYGRARIGAGGGFMGLTWDATGVAFDPATWRAVLRVLKPGGHLLSFGGTRTSHRMAVAIEDAGFEIRDSIHWMYATGFPKSLNISKGLALSDARCTCATIPEHSVQSMQAADLPAPVRDSEAARDAMQPCVSQPDLPDAWVEADDRQIDRPEQPLMEGRSDVPVPAGQLPTGAVCALPCGTADDGPEGRLRDGAPAGDGGVGRPSVDADGGRASLQPPPPRKRARQPRTVAGQPESQARGAWPLCARCGEPLVPDGLGTALKPAHEPILLARKPLTGTVAQNILAHGTGALNIDACRIGYQSDADRASATPQGDCTAKSGALAGGVQHDGARSTFERPEQKGRWPANVILDESSAADLDAQSGELRARGNLGLSKGGGGMYGHGPCGNAFGAGDTGGASRFFYCAKASRAERERGCEALPLKTAGEVTGGRQEGSDGLNSPRAGAGRTSGARNVHPTVKPVALMRYLVRLITPPGGTVCDPFMGSGSTGIAARAEGFGFLGMELSPEYVEIARARLGLADETESTRTD